MKIKENNVSREISASRIRRDGHCPLLRGSWKTLPIVIGILSALIFVGESLSQSRPSGGIPQRGVKVPLGQIVSNGIVNAGNARINPVYSVRISLDPLGKVKTNELVVDYTVDSKLIVPFQNGAIATGPEVLRMLAAGADGWYLLPESAKEYFARKNAEKAAAQKEKGVVRAGSDIAHPGVSEKPLNAASMPISHRARQMQVMTSYFWNPPPGASCSWCKATYAQALAMSQSGKSYSEIVSFLNQANANYAKANGKAANPRANDNPPVISTISGGSFGRSGGGGESSSSPSVQPQRMPLPRSSPNAPSVSTPQIKTQRNNPAVQPGRSYRSPKGSLPNQRTGVIQGNTGGRVSH